ncbi:MAG: sulfite exporter TauE/SafE family protein, partial [Lentisphaerae bacterium]|nr:sulfite exporter TauE/SafE family protein [Lentisphaerota bacterium]
ITGDLFAVAFYRRAALWRRLWELFPSVLVGLTLGALALSRLNSGQLKPLLGGLIIGLLALELLRDRLGWNQVPHRPWFIVGIGVLAGFTTTLGNASGPIVSIYFISRGLDKSEFMGTGAWYYLLINCAKVPIYAWQGMITPDTLRFDLMLAPLVIVGALAGYWLLNRIPRRGFKTVVLLLALAGAIRLFV